MFQLLLLIIYLSFISLGLPDGLLGAAWPSIYPELGLPVSYAGIVSMIIAAGTVVSSLQSDRLNKYLGTGKVTAFSVAMTMVALFGFSISRSFLSLCLWAVPYGLGAGSVDAALNNYVALHYESRHMSWLHCMWGLGAMTGPYVMGQVLAGGRSWTLGYRIIGLLQLALTAVLFLTLSLWKTEETKAGGGEEDRKLIPLRTIVSFRGVREVMVCFFCYCAVESTAGLWASSYLHLFKGIPAEKAAFYGSLFYIGITAGRALSGFITMKFSDKQMIRMGLALFGIGILIVLLPPEICSLAGLVVIGLGCAPVYPCIIHSTPDHFGADKSQAIIGVQMASAYVGTCLMPPVFGILADRIGIALFPYYLLLILVLMAVMHERLNSKTGMKNSPA